MRLLVDHGSSHNLGDTAMIEGVVLHLQRAFPNAQIAVVDHPRLVTHLYDSGRILRNNAYSIRIGGGTFLGRLRFFHRYRKAWQRWVQKALLASIIPFSGACTLRLCNAQTGVLTLGDYCAPFDALHIVGGGNLTDVFEPELFHRCCLIHAFLQQGKPVVATGQQLGPFRSYLYAMGLRKTLRKINFVGLREPTESVTLCKTACLSPDRFAVMGDDSFGLLADPPERVDPTLATLGLQPHRFLAWNVRFSRYNSSLESYLDHIAALAARIAGRFEMPLLVVPIALNPGDSDVAGGKRLAERIKNVRVAILEKPDLTPAFVKGVLGRAFGAVGASYHFCTFALSQGTPAVCIYDGPYYAQKARGLAAFWGESRLALALDGMDATSASESVCKLFHDASYREACRLRAMDAIKQWETTFEETVRTAFSEINVAHVSHTD